MSTTRSAAGIDGVGFLDTFFREASRRKIMVVGDVILDEYVFGEVKRISPEAPVPVVDYLTRSFVAGGAGNVAANIAALGGAVFLVGVVGDDESAQQLRSAIDKVGIGNQLITDRDRPTTMKMRIIAHDRQLVRLDRESRRPISGDVDRELTRCVEEHLPHCDACILSDYGKGTVTPTVAARVIDRCRTARIPVFVDPKSLAVSACRGATLVKPNKQEAERLCGAEIVDEPCFLASGRRLVELLDGSAVIITRGALGMSLFRRALDPFHVATAARNVYDVTGAGDTVISACALAVAAGATLEQAVWLASQSAAVVVEKLGTATVTPRELTERWRK